MTAFIDLEYPIAGRWFIRNSPADRVPSHGTCRFAAAYAIDFVPIDHAIRTTSLTFGSLLHLEPPERFSGFGRTLLAPIHGIVAAGHDSEPDHPAYRGLCSIGYALTQQRQRSASDVQRVITS